MLSPLPLNSPITAIFSVSSPYSHWKFALIRIKIIHFSTHFKDTFPVLSSQNHLTLLTTAELEHNLYFLLWHYTLLFWTNCLIIFSFASFLFLCFPSHVLSFLFHSLPHCFPPSPLLLSFLLLPLCDSEMFLLRNQVLLLSIIILHIVWEFSSTPSTTLYILLTWFRAQSHIPY